MSSLNARLHSDPTFAAQLDRLMAGGCIVVDMAEWVAIKEQCTSLADTFHAVKAEIAALRATVGATPPPPPGPQRPQLLQQSQPMAAVATEQLRPPPFPTSADGVPLLPNGRPKYPMWVPVADVPGGGVEVQNAAEEEYVRKHGAAGMPGNRLPPLPPPSYAEVAQRGFDQAMADKRARDLDHANRTALWMGPGLPLG
jgi:hypothetical protein